MKQLTKIIAVIATLTSLFAATSAQAQERTVRLNAFETRSFTYNADRGEVFQVEISGNGMTDVDLRVKKGSSRNLFCEEMGPTDQESCIVLAPRSGEYTIELENLEAFPNRVQLVVY